MARRVASRALTKLLSDTTWHPSPKPSTILHTATSLNPAPAPLSSIQSLSGSFQRCFTGRSVLLAAGRDEQSDILGGSSRSRDSRVPENLTEEDIKSKPMIFDFSGMPPDESAAKLADSVKSNMWTLHREHPDIWTVERLAREYKIRKERVHAILWLKDNEKKMEEESGEKLADDVEKASEEHYGTTTKGTGEKYWKVTRNASPLLSDEENRKQWEEASLKEAAMKLSEFETRMQFNKRLMNGEVFVKRESRRRPEKGWAYMVEELGAEGKRGRRGGRRFVVEGEGVQRGLNDLEKDYLKRESQRPRRRTIPR